MTNRIDRALKGELSVDALDGEEQEQFLERFCVLMASPSEEEKAFCAQLDGPGDDDHWPASLGDDMPLVAGTVH
jgi:hypothetical protein